MRKDLISAVAVLALASCSNDSLVTDSPANTEAPIAFTVGQRNITRAANDLNENGYNDFGVFAYKVKSGEGVTPEQVMGNYKVAYTAANGETAASWDYVGKVNGQVTRYWDYSTAVTNFYAYAPYAAGTKLENNKIVVTSTAGYEATNDVIYAGTSVAKESGYGKKVLLQFKHVGAKVNVAFRENVPGYKVQLINVSTDDKSGIQLTPAIKTTSEGVDSYTSEDAKYNTTSKVTIDYSTLTSISTSTSTEGATTATTNLQFAIPSTTADGLVVYPTGENVTPQYNVLPEVPTNGTANYAVSPTTYYAVVQPTNPTTGFTLHISYKLIAEDNGEEIIVRDARAFIPASAVAWESNKAYTYNFTISNSSTGNTGGNVDTTSPDPTVGGLSPIVFDTPTITDYDSATISPSDTEI